jgi:hypothetical protein
MNKANIQPYLLGAAIISGFLIRLLMLPYDGMFDVNTYHEWGLSTLNNGLHFSYQGIYFPIQYQIFEFGTWLSIKLNINFFIVLKSINLIFDCGNLFMLYLIFQKQGISKFYLLIYWLHPWFLNMFSLGYCDFQFTFFILTALYYSLKTTAVNYLITGFFLGVAFLMKPQVQIIFLSFFIYCSIRYFKYKDLRPFLIFIFPGIFFLGYSIYFSFYSSLGFFRLAWSYLTLSDSSPYLNANFLNAWFPIAYLMKVPGDPIYSISDKISIFHIQIRFLAIILVLFIMYYFIKRLNQKNSIAEDNFSLFFIACISTIVLPNIMTGAHENHLFLGTILLIPVLGMTKKLFVRFCIHIILILQFINLFGFYGAGDIRIFRFSYTYETAFILSIIAFISFLIVLNSLRLSLHYVPDNDKFKQYEETN